MKKHTIWIIAVLAVVLLGACAGQNAAGDTDPTPDTSNGPTWQEQYDLGVRYLSEGKYQEAIIAFTAAIEIDPKQAPAYVGRGDAYVLSGETEHNLAAAKADYEMAIELDETIAEAYLGLADVYIRQGDYEKALEVLREGLEKCGNSQEIADKIAEIESGNISDSSGKARRMTGYDGNGNVVFWHDYIYDEQGRQASATSYDAAGAQTGHVDMVYDSSSGNKLVTWGYVLDTGVIEKIELTYDRSGNVISRTWFHGNEVSTITTMEYNDAGQLIQENYKDAAGNITSFRIFEYDADGKEMKFSDFGEDGTLYNYCISEYDSAGNLQKRSWYNGDGSLSGYEIMQYDEKGKYIGHDWYNADGSLQQSTIYD